MEKAQQTCDLWARTYPRAWEPHGFLTGIIYPVLGKYDKAVEEGKKTIALNPEFAITYDTLAMSYQALDRLVDAENILRRAADRRLELPDFVWLRYDIAFLRGDRPGIERLAAEGRRSGAEEPMAYHEGSVLAYSGSLAAGKRKVAARGGPGAADSR